MSDSILTLLAHTQSPLLIAVAAPEERTTVERLLGRALRSDEAVEIVTHPIAANGTDRPSRKQVAERILALAKGKSAGGLSARELIKGRANRCGG